MNGISFEDRTTETKEQAAQRQIEGVAAVLGNVTFAASRGDGPLAIAALATVLGQLTARLGASLEDVILLVQRQHATSERDALEGMRVLGKLADA